MRKLNIFLVLTTLLSIANGYEIKCKKYYKTKKGDDLYKIAIKNRVSANRILTLNPDFNNRDIKIGSSVCVKGKINFSKDRHCGKGKGSCPFGECCSARGICGKSAKHCGVGCNPKYGMCIEDFNEAITVPQNENLDEFISNSKAQAIKDIMKKLNMTRKEAKRFYKYANKGFSFFDASFKNSVNKNYSLEDCKKNCEEANIKFNRIMDDKSNNFNLTQYNQFLEAHDEPKIDHDTLYNSCLSKCFVIQEIYEHDMENENNDTSSPVSLKNIKREDSSNDCQPASEGKISLVNENYKNGCAQYQQDEDSADTCVATLNGCSLPLVDKLYNANDFGLFVPACNSHDLCYGCMAGKSYCDDTFYNNMKSLCKLYNKWYQVASGRYALCIAEAEIFYASIKYTKIAQKAYDDCKIFNNDVNCAFCGTKIIQDTLLKSPFYVKL